MLMFIVGTIQRASGDIDRDAEYALSKLLQIGTVTEYQKEFEMLIKRVTIPESLLKSFFYLGLNWLYNVYSLGLILQLWEKPFFRARIIEARFEDENNQAVDANVGDQEEPKVKDKQEVKNANNQEIENIQDEEDKNVEDQQVSEADDDTNIVDFSLFYLSSSILGLIWTVKNNPNGVFNEVSGVGYSKADGTWVPARRIEDGWHLFDELGSKLLIFIYSI
ncbi:hypothetical protein Tco_1503027 [Tanacetum coccineum]